MFYAISKVFWLLAQPVSLAFLFGLGALVLAVAGRRRSGLALGVLGLLILGVASFTNVGAVAIAPLEARFARPAELPERVDAIVLLGGATAARVSTARQVTETSEAGDRLIETIWLAQRYLEARIVLTGGVAAVLAGAESEAVTMQRLLLAFGIAPERVVLEGEARNTDENAEYTKALLGPAPGNVLLVTSAFHMPRSMGLFRKVGISAIAWPTDYRSTGTERFEFDVAEPIANLLTSSVAMKEWIGLVVYHWTGRIDDMLPGQASN
ncbi:YdcF family protein [Devosia ginsengisoli]|uniref:YdcF family protein n=1 Tax=Devosia ginsengisoli TaxID=400770 RepID=UPI0026EBF44C|nr:YdcF family protein [Devosia ginsengisoli]MCR6671647.1 YdcF family protein [Devosia ginsengisoli]